MSDQSTRFIPPDPKVRVIFRGFIVAQIKHGTTSALVGALAPSVSLCHQPKIRIYKLLLPQSGASGPALQGQSIDITPTDLVLANNFSLTVIPEPAAGIEKYQQDDDSFNRHDEKHNNRKDFRWFIDLDEIHGEPVGKILNKLNPQFTMNKGVFHTSDRSEGEVRINPKAHDPTKPIKHFAKFATEITARVVLKPESKDQAIFLNGTRPIFAVGTGAADEFIRYEIVYDCSCRVNEDAEESDFPLIYQVITVSDPKKKVDMEPEELVDLAAAGAKEDGNKATSPEVYCMGGNSGGG